MMVMWSSVLSSTSIASWLPSAQPLMYHFADNQAANGAVVRAYSGARDLADIVRCMHDVWDELDIDPWIEYVRSAANLADWPSRLQTAELDAMGAVRVSFRVLRL